MTIEKLPLVGMHDYWKPTYHVWLTRCLSISCYKEAPNVFHRFMLKLFLGITFTWEENKNG